MRLALVQTLLEGRREAEALQEAQCAAKFALDEVVGGGCAAVSYLLGCCLLRLGERARGLTALEDAVAQTPPPLEQDLQWLLGPLHVWGERAAQQLLLVHSTAEKCKAAAVEVRDNLVLACSRIYNCILCTSDVHYLLSLSPTQLIGCSSMLVAHSQRRRRCTARPLSCWR